MRQRQRSPRRPEGVAGTDLLIARELTGGIYFGLPRERTDAERFVATSEMAGCAVETGG